MKGRARALARWLAIGLLMIGLQALGLLALGSSARAAPAAALAEPADPQGIAARLEDTLKGGDQPFCRDTRHRLASDERALCELASAAAERCPAFAAACAGKEPSDAELPAWWRELGALLGTLGYLVFWLLLIAAAGILGWLSLRLLQASLPARDGAARAEGSSVPASEPELPDFERAFQAHLDQARRLAAQSKFAEAAAELQLGVVLRLDALGLILARRGRTNGDYARDLASQPELQGAFGALTRATEAVQFGGRGLDQSAFQRLLEQAAPLLTALALVLGALAGPLACQSAEPSLPPPSLLSLSCGGGAEGHSLFCQLFDSGEGVRPRFRPLEGPGAVADDVATIVVLPNHLDDSAWPSLLAWVEAGGVAVLATPVASLDERWGVSRSATACGSHAAVLPSSERSLLVSVGPSLEAPKLAPSALCETGEPYIVHASWGAGRVIFLSTPELLSNASLVAGDNARLLANLLDLPDGRVEIIGSSTRQSMQSPFSAVAAAGLAPWLCQLLLLGAAFAAYRGMPFGRRVEVQAHSRRRFSEHVQALGQRWADQRASRSALSAYAAYGLELLRERVPAGAGRSSAELARAIAQKTGRAGTSVAPILDRTRRAQEGEGSGTETEDLQALRELGRLIEDLGGPR